MGEAEDVWEARNGQRGMGYLAFRVRPRTSMKVITAYLVREESVKSSSMSKLA
jgi:hypothetical protein